MSKPEQKLTVHNQCYSCPHRREVPGSVHTRCTARWDTLQDMPKGHRIGVRGGWWWFPMNFDPVWHTDWCPQHPSQQEGGDDD